MMVDSLKTASVGIVGSTVYWVTWVPPLFSALAALATFLYMCLKIWGEIDERTNKKSNRNSR